MSYRVWGAVLVLSFLVAGCGGTVHRTEESPAAFARQPVDEIIGEANAAMGGVSALEASGKVKIGTFGARFSVETDRAGTCAGSMTLAAGRIRFVRTKGATYLKADPSYWRKAVGSKAPTLISFLAGRWGMVPPMTQLDGICDLASRFSTLKSDAVTGGATASTFAGQPVAVIRRKADGRTAGTLYVGAAAPHYVLGVSGAIGNDFDGTLRFSQFGATKTVHVPTGSEAIALS